MTTLTLRIIAHDPPPGWKARWYLEDGPVAEPIPVNGLAIKATEDLGRRFLDQFEGRARRFTNPDVLRAMGRDLFTTWFAPAWPSIQARLKQVPGPYRLVIQSVEHVILILPWELVELDHERPSGCDAGWSLCRSPLMEARECRPCPRGDPPQGLVRDGDTIQQDATFALPQLYAPGPTVPCSTQRKKRCPMPALGPGTSRLPTGSRVFAKGSSAAVASFSDWSRRFSRARRRSP